MILQKSLLACLLLVGMMVTSSRGQDEEVFSGPQAGESLPNFSMKHGFGKNAGIEFDLVEKAGDQPIVIVFVHKRSRPAFALANSVMRYCNQEGGDKLTRGICFLTADPTDTQNWLARIKNYFPKNTPVGYSVDGVEGPGAYGLNRNVQLTVLVGDEKKVRSNFALIQPGAHTDGPRILEAIAKVIGAKNKPDINNYLPSNQAAQDAPIAIDPRLMKQIRKMNQKDATDEAVGEALEQIETLVMDSKPLQRQLGSIITRWVRTKRVDSIGTAEHQEKIKQMAKDYGPQMNRRMNRDRRDRPQGDQKLAGLLRSVIQKSNSDEQVDAAAQKVETYIEQNPNAAKEIARITNTIVNSDKLSNYGTARAQEYLKEWAEKYRNDK